MKSKIIITKIAKGLGNLGNLGNLGIGMASVIALAMLVPLLVPIPSLEGTVPSAQLADADSRFIELAGVDIHYKMTGAGEPSFLLLHGFGASVYSWHKVMEPLSAWGTVIAYDRPAFGLTERPLTWAGGNPYSTEAQPEIALGLLDAYGVERAVLVGHSAGGTLAVYSALLHPERVAALILISPAIYTGGGAPPFVRPLLRTPQARRVGPLLVRSLLARGESLLDSAWHDSAKITAEMRAGYTLPFRAENWDQALWEMTLATEYPDLVSQLGALTLPVLVITGDDDRIVPTADSIRLAGEIPGAELVVIPNAGHVAHEEAPEAVLRAVEAFVAELKR